MVFASLVVVGVSTLIKVRRIGPIGGGAVLPMFTAAFSIPFCIAAVAEGGPGTLAALVLISAVKQLAISRWLFILRRVVTPIVGGTVMMILSITLASVVGIYDFDRVVEAKWVGLPSELPRLGFDFGISFWTLVPSFVFLGVIIAIQERRVDCDAACGAPW